MENTTAGSEDEQKPRSLPFFPVSEGKLITLYLLSFGLYGIYWFYQNWKYQQPLMDKKIYPALRALLSIFYVYSLFKRIDSQASQLDDEHRFNTRVYAALFIITMILSNVFDHAFGTDHPEDIINNVLIVASLLLFALSTIPMVKAQATANRVNGDLLGYLNHRYSFWNYLLILTGSILWILIIAGIIFNLTGLTSIVHEA